MVDPSPYVPLRRLEWSPEVLAGYGVPAVYPWWSWLILGVLVGATLMALVWALMEWRARARRKRLEAARDAWERHQTKE